jgi:hypothetical protein
MHPCKEIAALLRRYNYEFVRHNKHMIYRHKVTGKIVAVVTTGSCSRTIQNTERNLRRAARDSRNENSRENPSP